MFNNQQQAEVELAAADPSSGQSRDTRIPLSQVSQASFGAAQQPRQKVRTRVSLPKQPEELAALEDSAESGPPKFALSSDEDIQRFRDANRFSPQGDQVLNRIAEGSFMNNVTQVWDFS